MSNDDLVAALALIFAGMFLVGAAGGLVFGPSHPVRPQVRRRSGFCAIRTFWNGGIRFGSSRVVHFPTGCSQQRVCRLIGISRFRLYQDRTWVYFREGEEAQRCGMAFRSIRRCRL
jgi:hypothetical protein